jgi:hypothetical protein
MSIETRWIDGELRAKRADGQPLTEEDRQEIKTRMAKPGITVKDVLGVFGGGFVVRLDLECTHCNKVRIIKANWPGHECWQCHYCGREASAKVELLRAG